MSTRASRLVIGSVRHRRHRPVVNAFRYRTYYALLDVDELPMLDRELRGFGYNRWAPIAFRDTDHLGAVALPVREKLARWLADEGVALPAGRVRVLANLRVAGHVFDPVSWWFCHDADGRLALIVAEVRNTFGESHCYLLDELEVDPSGAVRARADKVFHVSPFLPIAGLRYRFAFVLDRARIVAHIDVEDAEGRLFDATQSGRLEELTARSLWRQVARNPLLPLRTVLLIHTQAVGLWWRRVTFHRRPTPPPDGYDRVAHQTPTIAAAASTGQHEERHP